MDSEAQSVLKLAYWHTRGRGMPIRFLLEYLAFPYEEKIYTLSEAKKAEWFSKDKHTLSTDYPNLPYLEDGGQILTESLAILQYLADKSDDSELKGSSPIQRAKIQQALLVTNDFRVPIRGVAFGLEERQAAFEKAKPFMQRFENVLSKQKWIAGEHLTYADFYLYEVFILFLALYGTEELAKFSHIPGYLTAFEQLPRIANYLRSEKYQKYEYMFPTESAKEFNGAEFFKNYNKKFLVQ